MSVTDSTPRSQQHSAGHVNALPDSLWDEVRASLCNLRYGSVTIIVQDGVIIQIDRTDKRRLQPRRATQRGP